MNGRVGRTGRHSSSLLSNLPAVKSDLAPRRPRRRAATTALTATRVHRRRGNGGLVRRLSSVGQYRERAEGAFSRHLGCVAMERLPNVVLCKNRAAVSAVLASGPVAPNLSQSRGARPRNWPSCPLGLRPCPPRQSTVATALACPMPTGSSTNAKSVLLSHELR